MHNFNSKRIMKKISIYFVLVFITLITTQCKKAVLDKPIYGVQSNETFYKTDVQIDQALTGAYLQLRQTWNEYAKNHYFVGDISTDDAWKGGGSEGDYSPLADVANFTLNPTNDVVNLRWGILYRLISRCNEVIAYAPAAEGDKAKINRYILEAKLLRGFGYYELATVFGGVPMPLTPLTPDEAVSTPKSTEDEIFAQAAKDFTEAAEGLPTKSQYDAADKYRVSSGLAYTMLGKLYMFQRNYPEAEKALQKVVESGVYSLNADYGENWRTDNTTESIFEINNKVADRNVPLGTNVPLFFGSRNTAGYQGYGFHLPTQDLYDEFTPDDPRITYTFTRTGDRFVGDSPTTGDQDNSLSPTDLGDRKILVPEALRQNMDSWMVSYNIRLIRYSDALLLYAEALNENGKGGQAITYLNQVRRRARLTAPEDPQR
ncbi:MAG: RagB/SusD family nutrient uptake outer membrane protein, partial [Sphingobacteriales bacterium]